MKKVTVMLALVALVGNIANAELLKNFKYDGKIQVNAYATNNTADNDADTQDATSDVDTRVQVNMGFDLNEDVDAVVSLVKENRQYGDTGTANGENIDAITLNSIFEQAYLNLKGVFGFDHKLGRQYYGNEGDLVVFYGPKGWPYPAKFGTTALDAYTGWYKTGKWSMHGVAGKALNLAGSVNEDDDTDLLGFVANYDLREEIKLGAYVYEQKDYNDGAADLTLDVVGVKAMGKIVGIDYTAELAKNYGHQAAGVNYEGMGFLANAKYGMDLAGKITFMGEIARGSGDDNSTDDKVESFNAIASDYRPGILWGANMAGLKTDGVTANSGLTTWNVGAMWTPSMAEKLDLCAKYVYLAPTEDKLNGASIGYDTVGSEFDVAATWNHSDNVKVKAYVAYFMPDKDYATASGSTNDDAATMIGAAFKVKF